jgi:hypothetical protein
VAHGDGWRVPPRPASFFAVNAADAAWVDRQCTMHRCPALKRRRKSAAPATASQASGTFWRGAMTVLLASFYAKAGERRWWREELACGHDVMLDMPNELTALLLQRS